MGFNTVLFGGLASMIFVLGADLRAEVRPEKIHVADSKKSNSYIRDGLIIGGDHAIQGEIIQDIRRSSNADFERTVLDLAGVQNGEQIPLSRPPYYQIAVTPDEKRIVMTLWGHPKLGFDSKKVIQAFKRSSAIQNIVLLPLLEEDSWTFMFELKSGFAVEVFELTQPTRVILDIQRKKG